MTFANADAQFHSVFSASPSNLFEIASSRRSVSGTKLFSGLGVAHLQCNLHPAEGAKVFVLPTPYFAITDADGTWTLRAPDGRWKVVAIEANGGRAETTVASCRQVDLALDAQPPPTLRHKDQSAY